MDRNLTPAESRVIGILLGASGGGEKERVAMSGLPRSTYVVARRRAYDEGWVYDRYLPSPDLGLRYITFAVARPYAEGRDTLIGRWRSMPGTCVLWALPDHLFAVLLHANSAEAKRSRTALQVGPAAQIPLMLTSDLAEPQIPAYFDYQGVWAHVAGVPPGLVYPRPLGLAAPDRPPVSLGLRQRAHRILSEPPRPDRGEGERRFFGPLGFSKPDRRLVSQGWLEWRVFPNLARLPPVNGVRLQRQVLIWGQLAPGTRPETLFQDLRERCRVFPILFATDGHQVLVAAVGVGEGTPALELVGQGRTRPVLATLQEHLRGIESTSADVDRIDVVVDHRYSDLVSLSPEVRRPSRSPRQEQPRAPSRPSSGAMSPGGP